MITCSINSLTQLGKKSMILRMMTLFEEGDIMLPYKTERDKQLTDQLADELTTFALDGGKLVETGIHADISIALGMALERLYSGGTIIDI